MKCTLLGLIWEMVLLRPHYYYYWLNHWAHHWHVFCSARGALPNEYNSAGMTPLHEAMRRGDRSVVEELLTFGAKPELTVSVGYGAAQCSWLGWCRWCRILFWMSGQPNIFCFCLGNRIVHSYLLFGDVQKSDIFGLSPVRCLQSVRFFHLSYIQCLYIAQ